MRSQPLTALTRKTQKQKMVLKEEALAVEEGMVEEAEMVVMVVLAKGKETVAPLAEKEEVVVVVVLAKGKDMAAALAGRAEGAAVEVTVV
jgi:hypothetical protein